MVNKNSSASSANPGDELWAFVPTPVIPNLWRLADSDYDNSHRYYVDATPNVSDVFDGTNWRTILVGGLGAGGRGYFALDVTDPLVPTVLWEFTSDSDADQGLSFGNPVITKNKSGTWVVAFTSGYNNLSPGSGVGQLFIVNAITGALLQKLGTAVGDTTTPSNLGRINAWVLKDTDNTALRYYGGDMLGNLWRFDADDLTPPTGSEAFLLGKATTPTGGVQAITAKPLLTEIVVGAGTAALISFGTGRYIGDTDLTDATMQTIYTVKDALLGTGLGALRSTSANLVQETLGSNRKLLNPPAIDWTASNGWYVDLSLSTRERVYLDATPVVPGIISVASTIPNGDPCSTGGESWIYDFDLKAGTLTQATHYDVSVVGLSRVVSISGARDLVTTQDGLGTPPPPPPPPTSTSYQTRRTSWRELQD
jgi:type IV pilus assembly protein PilY1